MARGLHGQVGGGAVHRLTHLDHGAYSHPNKMQSFYPLFCKRTEAFVVIAYERHLHYYRKHFVFLHFFGNFEAVLR